MFNFSLKSKYKNDLTDKFKLFLSDMKLDNLMLSHDDVNLMRKMAINITVDYEGNTYDALIIYFLSILESDSLEKEINNEASDLIISILDRIFNENLSINGLAHTVKYQMIKTMYSTN